MLINAMQTEAVPLVEPSPVSDAFCSELATVERIGPCVRLTFAVLQASPGVPNVERAIVAKVVIPAEAVAAMLIALARPSKALSATVDTADAADRPTFTN